jgi:hypothetical protein
MILTIALSKMQCINWFSLIYGLSFSFNYPILSWLIIMILNIFGCINQNIFIFKKLIESIIIVYYMKSFIQLYILFQLLNPLLYFPVILSIGVFKVGITIYLKGLILLKRLIQGSIWKTNSWIINAWFLLLFQHLLSLNFFKSFFLPLLVVHSN